MDWKNKLLINVVTGENPKSINLGLKKIQSSKLWQPIDK